MRQRRVLAAAASRKLGVKNMVDLVLDRREVFRRELFVEVA